MAELSAESVVSRRKMPSPSGRPDRVNKPSPSRPATPITSSKLGSRIFSPIKNIFRRQASPANQGAPRQEIVPDHGIGNPSIPVPETLISPGIDITFKEEGISSAQKVDMYEKAILVINIFDKAVNLAEIVLPSGVGDTLEMLVNVLEVLKQMVENEEAWKGLLLTLDDHRKQFNDQITRLKQENVKRDSSSPLLEPLGRYSEALRRITAKVINDSGLMQGNLPETSAWSKIKRFVTRYREAGSEKGKIQGYHDELLAAMRDLMQGLVTYTAFEVHDIRVQVDRIAEVIVGRPVSKRKVKAKVPPRVTSFYVRREAEWNLLMHHLVDSDIPGQKILPITGMGGCGKTQLVAYFLRENKDKFPNVVYVDASSAASIKADLQTWAQSLGDVHENDEWDDGLEILADRTLDERWAYILDNADDTQLNLPMFLPDSDAVTVIITSRNGLLGSLATTCHLKMGEMTEDEALFTLAKAAKRQLPIPSDELKSAQVLVQEMGGLALALAQAGGYCHSMSPDYSFNQYLSVFRSTRAQLMKNRQLFPVDKYERGVYTTLDLSYSAMSALAKEFFHLTSYFRYSDIPVAMLAAAAKRHFKDPIPLLPRSERHGVSISGLNALFCDDGYWKQFQTEEIIQTLHSFSLVSTTVIEDSLFLRYHPLVKAWIRDMPSSNAESYRTMATQILTSCCTENNIAIYRYLLPHIIEVLEDNKHMSLHVNDKAAFAEVLMEVGRYNKAELLFGDVLKSLQQVPGNNTKKATWISIRLAIVYTRQGRWDEAEKLQLEVLEKQTKILGADHPHTIIAANNLANTYHIQGRLAEAEKLQLEVLEKRTKILGADHPDTISAANNLANTYHVQGRFTEAEKLKLEVLEKRTKILGADNPDTIIAANNLASTYHVQGRSDEAEKLKLEVLEKRTKILGADHPDTISAANNLAATYHVQGRSAEAEKLQLEVLEKRTKILGRDHPDTCRAAANLAVTYRSQGRLDEAEKLQLEVLEKRTKILGADHPDTISEANNLAATYHVQGRSAEAEKLQLEVLEKRTKILGADHPDTFSAANNLAATYEDQGRFAEAEKLLLEVLEKRTIILGADHPETVTAANNLAITYQEQGRFDEAEKLYLEVLEKRMTLLGADNPSTIDASASLASLYYNQVRWDEAGRLELEVLEKRSKILGLDHPDTVSAVYNLGITYHQQGRFDEAEKLYLEVLEKRSKMLGADHPDTIFAANNLAATYHRQGRFNEAEKLKLEVLEKRTKILGADHPDTFSAANNLAATYEDQGRFAEAEKLLLEVLEKRTIILGADHPDTVTTANNLAITYQEQGRLAEAEKLKLEVLEKRTKILGADHPDTFSAANNLAATYQEQGRFDEAEKLYLEVLEKWTKLLGADHPSTLRAANNLAATYEGQGRLAEAEKLRLEVLEKRKKVLGPDHPDTRWAAATLATTYRSQGRLDEAERLEVDGPENETAV